MNSKPLIAALLSAALALLLLSGCAPKIVSVPVACVQVSDVPPETQKPTLTGNAAADALILLDTVLALRNETGDLRALLAGCVT